MVFNLQFNSGAGESHIWSLTGHLYACKQFVIRGQTYFGLQGSNMNSVAAPVKQGCIYVFNAIHYKMVKGRTTDNSRRGKDGNGHRMTSSDYVFYLLD